MELLKSSIFADCSTHRYAPIDPDCESRSSPIASRRPAFVINCTGLVLGAGLPGGAGEPQHESNSSLDPTNKNAALADRAPACLGRRPTDLCATALFSFQGTDASAQPVSDRITDRTVGARRQSQRGIPYHRVSMMSTARLVPLSTVLSTPARASGSRSARADSPYKERAFSPSRWRGRRRRARPPFATPTALARTAASSRNRPLWSRSRSC